MVIDAATGTDPIQVDLTSSPETQESPVIIDLSSSQEPNSDSPPDSKPQSEQVLPDIDLSPPHPTSDSHSGITSVKQSNTIGCNGNNYLLPPASESPTVLPSAPSIPKSRPVTSAPSTSLSRIFPPPGLDNLGSTCYANAILHSLFFLPELWKVVQVSLSDTPLLKELKSILMVLNSSRCAVKPRKFLKLI